MDAAPGWSVPVLKLANVCAYLEKDLEAAERLYRKAKALNSTDTDVDFFLEALPSHHLEAGAAFEKEQRAEEAAASYAEAVRLSPNRAEVHGRLGVVMQSLGRLDEAVEAYESALRVSPEDSIAAFNCGIAHSRRGDPEAAAVAFRRATVARPSHSASWFNLGVALRDAGAVDEAIEAYEAAARTAPSDMAPVYNLANALTAKGDTAGAITQYRRAIGINPKAADAYAKLRVALADGQITSTAAAGAPLVVTRKAALSADEFADLQRQILAHPWLQFRNTLSSSFAGTRGFVVRFNADGFSRDFISHPQLRCLVDYVNRARLPEANAFVINVLVVDPSSEQRRLSVKRHLDMTVGLYSTEVAYVAHQARGLPERAGPTRNKHLHPVDVLYVSLPPEMEGGKLLLWSPSAAPESTPPPPDTVIAPEENMQVSFRGDAKHGVQGFGAVGGRPRISLVLEQYVIDARHYPKTVEFDLLTEEHRRGS